MHTPSAPPYLRTSTTSKIIQRRKNNLYKDFGAINEQGAGSRGYAT